MLDRAPPAWRRLVEAWRASADGQRLERFVSARQQAGAAIYPREPLRALALTPRERVRVVIVGQDPYHGEGQAEGLAFSVPPGQALPPSLRNIYVELGRDLGLPRPAHGHLTAWAERGVLLLNTSLTVEAGRPASHAKQGWEALTDEIIAELARSDRACVYMLWGAHAQAKARLIGPGAAHAVLCANHPSPLSARRPPLPFIGCGHFGAANRFLAARGEAPIDWAPDQSPPGLAKEMARPVL
ncbi:MAG TPA: uracil-DNA glycosylase [Burkholderiaceae bacterium]|nr:uracil-DNA glycosylase [Burkholderiaceae bacterium]